MTEERCYRLVDDREAVEVRSEAAKELLVAQGFAVVAAIDCVTGAITVQADPEYVCQGEREWAAFDALPEEEQRALRRQVGGVQVASAAPQADATWGETES